MSIELAKELCHTGRSHAAASCLLYRATVEHAVVEGIEDTASHAFNGPNSLSIQYLLGLGLELMLKSAIVACDPDVDAKYLQNKVGHDLVGALDEAEKRGFVSEAPNLREILEVLRAPYKQHWFRYERPEQFQLPADFDQIVEALPVLEEALQATLALAGAAEA